MSIHHLICVLCALFGLIAQASAQSLAPRFVPCPSAQTMLRSSISSDLKQRLGSQEAHYISARRSKVARKAYAQYLKNVKLSLAGSSRRRVGRADAFPQSNALPAYVDQILGGGDVKLLPRAGFALSGGGLRATHYSLGVLSAFDGRNPTSAKVGTGGLLDAADYLGGLSGSSWAVLGLAHNAFDLSTAPGSKGFGGLLAQYDLFTPATGLQSSSKGSDDTLNQKYMTDAFVKMGAKAKAGFKVTMTDLWGLLLRFHIIDGTTESNFFDFTLPHGAGATFSGIRNLPTFKGFEQPYPIITALGLSSDKNPSKVQPGAFLPTTSTPYEFTVYESGSWDSNLASFIPTEYLGSRLTAGLPQDPQKCVNDFDKASYLAAISSDIFSSMNTSDRYMWEESSIKTLLKQINTTFGQAQPKISIDTASVPNSFFGSGGNGYPDKHSTDLRLTDGGLDGAVTPYYPLMIPARAMDVIIGVDAISLDHDSGDNYSTGSSLKAAAARAALDPKNNRFPKVPQSSQEYLQLRNHPTFFGCEEPETPLVVWLPNSAPLDGSRGVTNTSINKVQYSISDSQKFISAAAEIGYRGYPSPQQILAKQYRDPIWGGCAACAVVDRSRHRLGVQRTGLCAQCFDRHCWKG